MDVYAALRDLGYQSFRPGQEEAIMRILSGVNPVSFCMFLLYICGNVVSHLSLCPIFFRPLYPCCAVNRDGQIVDLSAASLPVRSAVEIHRTDHFTPRVTNG